MLSGRNCGTFWGCLTKINSLRKINGPAMQSAWGTAVCEETAGLPCYNIYEGSPGDKVAQSPRQCSRYVLDLTAAECMQEVRSGVSRWGGDERSDLKSQLSRSSGWWCCCTEAVSTWRVMKKTPTRGACDHTSVSILLRLHCCRLLY